MRSLVVFGGHGAVRAAGSRVVTVDGVSVPCAVVPTPCPGFDSGAEANTHAVLIRVRALSCNYRDRTFVHGMRAVPAQRYSAIGSEFVAEVLDVGRMVTSLAPGDRVMPNHHYTGACVAGHATTRPAEGVVTNRASRAFHVVPAARLARVPDEMPDVEAAAFSLGAQTAHSVVRRLGLEPRQPVLLTAVGSNTSLFVFAALRTAGARVFATTSSSAAAERLRAAGAERVVVVPRGRGPEAEAGRRELSVVAAAVGGFDAVVDPFFDLHLEAVIDLLAPFGRYVTCGLAGQTEHSAAAAGVGQPIDGHRLMLAAILKNLSFVGNCLGNAADLERALLDYVAGARPIVIDSVYSGDDAAPFLDRSFNARDRVGKVVFQYA